MRKEKDKGVTGMMTILNRKRLLADSSGEAAAKATEALKAAGISYVIKTIQNHSALGKAIQTGAGARSSRGGMPSSAYTDQITYVYAVYVRGKDLERAKKVCQLG